MDLHFWCDHKSGYCRTGEFIDEIIDEAFESVDEGYYLSGTGELSTDDSYINYLNRN